MSSLDGHPPEFALPLGIQDAESEPVPGSEVQVLLKSGQGEQRTPALVPLTSWLSGPGVKIFGAELKILPAAQEKR